MKKFRTTPLTMQDIEARRAAAQKFIEEYERRRKTEYISPFSEIVTKMQHAKSFLREEPAHALARLNSEMEAVLPARRKKFLACCPLRYRECTLENFQTTHPAQATAMNRIRRFADKLDEHIANGVNVVFSGPCGTGKDHLMFSLLRLAAIDMETSAKWWHSTGGDFALHARKSKGDTPRMDYEDAFSSDASTADIIAISDPVLGGQTLAYYELQAFYKLVDDRYQSKLPTWLTINATTRQQMDEMLTPPIADRILDGAFVVHCNWPSYRKKGEFPVMESGNEQTVEPITTGGA